MKTIRCYTKCLSLPALAVLWLAGALSVNGAAKPFATPEEAVEALATAVNARDTNALLSLFGPGLEELRSPDPVQARNELAEFAAQLKASNHIEHTSDGRSILEVGEDRWPFAIPLAQKGGAWFFDTAAGKEELLNRRIGRNELDALQSMRAYVDAQRDYARKDRDGDGVLEYAQRMRSNPGSKDGLYWNADEQGQESPLGPLLAEAQSEGYLTGPQKENEPQPFHGYYFKILHQQGPHAPGGAYNYIINGNMIGGFALVAWPADYGNSGIMTFIINQQGKVYQKDLGRDTKQIVSNMTTYDPGAGWTPSRE